MAVFAVGSSCTTVTLSRSVMGALPVQPTAQVVPTGFHTVWAGAQLSPAAARDASGSSAVRYPQVMPELGTVFLTASRRVVLGGSVNVAHTSWSPPAHTGQPALRDGLLIGFRTRVGFRAEVGDPRFFLLGSIEPGIDLVPWSTNFATGAAHTPLPQISAALTPAAELGRVRVFAGFAAGSVLQMPSMITAPCTSCGEPGTNYAWYLAALAGVKVSVSDNLALAASLTVPVNWLQPQLMPMFSLAVMHQADQAPAPPPPPELEDLPPFYVEPSPEEAMPL